ncbi:MAG: DUF4126 family protein [Bryobacteraceae bacterium]
MHLTLAFLLGLVAGLRTMTAPAAASWAARLGLLKVADTGLAFMGFQFTPIIFTILALGELVNDKLPKTPSRKTPPQFIARIVSGALVGATVGAASEMLVAGIILGMIGAVAGTLGGAAVRGKLASLLGSDTPAALLEDGIAILISIISLAVL